ncbi:MAG: hypothetical protein L0H96_20680, partial [Humibacillus sp.]|nr:hypothetical protein [Humibacillus sp.]MDN5779314.1 hypothetical protein [Humibacillus sp.]
RFHTRCPWKQETRCDTERPQLRTVVLNGVPDSHRVACHFAEQIDSGEISSHQVTAVSVNVSHDAEYPDEAADGSLIGPVSIGEEEEHEHDARDRDRRGY